MTKKIKKLSGFEKYQSYIRNKKDKKLRDLTFKFRNELLDQETPTEIMFKTYLLYLKEKYEFQKIIYAGKSFYIVDFFIPRLKTVIEIDGKQHSEDEIVDRDIIRTVDLKKIGVKNVYRFTNNEVYKSDSCINRLKDILHKKAMKV